MNEILAMEGHGAYVWSAYGITLGVLIWNALSARARLRKNLADVRQAVVAEEPAPRPKVSQVGE